MNYKVTMAIKYDSQQAEDFFRTNRLVNIPEEVTALGIARKYRKEEEWNAALAELAKQKGFRKNGKSLQALLEEVCTRIPEREVVLYSGTTQVHDYDEKHLLIEEISCVDAQGKAIESHPQVWVMKDVIRNEKGEMLSFGVDKAVQHCEEQGYVLPSSQLNCALVAACFQHKYIPAAQKVLMQYGNVIHTLNTLVSYADSTIISYPYSIRLPYPDSLIYDPRPVDAHTREFPSNRNHKEIVLPFEMNRKGGWFKPNLALKSMNLEQSLKDELMSVFVRQFSGLPEPSILVEIGKYFGKEAHAWIYNARRPRVAWFGCDSGNLGLGGNGSNFRYGDYAARGVRFVAPETPRKNGE